MTDPGNSPPDLTPRGQSDDDPAAMVPLNDAEHAVLEAVRAKRGYTLPYHRMFAAGSADLLERYDAFYEALTLAPRVLTPLERETVWASILAAAREVHGFIHMERARRAGLDEAARSWAVAIAAVCEAHTVIAFAGGHWADWTGGPSLRERYLAMFEAARGRTPVALAHLAAVAAMGARRDAAGLRLHLERAFEAGITREQVAEALSYLMIPCGGNVLIDAVDAWVDAAAEGQVPAPY
ncbi:MAG: carboxymuconolactone decarboxylase family protein [Burkholderiaceae bacterium]